MKKSMAAYVKEWQSQGSYSFELLNKQANTLSPVPVSHSASLAVVFIYLFFFLIPVINDSRC